MGTTDTGRAGVEDALLHYGRKGMKWGVRKSESSTLKSLGPDKIVRKTKFGEEITLQKDKATAIHKTLAKFSDSYRENYANAAGFSIKDSKGKTVGGGSVWMKGDDELYLNWVGVKKSARGKGYATATLQAAEAFGREKGVKKMTLEVPANSPDARHIYEKMGFKVVKEKVDPSDPLWGGLTSMEYTFKQTAKHSDLNLEVTFSSFLDRMVEFMEKNESNDSIAQSGEAVVESVLAHVGVKGMKWGVRKDRKGSSGPSAVTVKTKPGKGVVKTAGGGGHGPSKDAVKKAKTKQKAKASSTDSLSNAELKRVVERMQLEQKYKDLSAKQVKKSKGKEFVKAILKNESDSLSRGKPGPITAALISALTVAAAAKAGSAAGYNSAARKAGKTATNQIIKGKVISESTRILR